MAVTKLRATVTTATGMPRSVDDSGTPILVGLAVAGLILSIGFLVLGLAFGVKGGP